MSVTLWTCPFCNRGATIRENDTKVSWTELWIENAEGPRVLVSRFTVCPNPDCRRFALDLSLHSAQKGYSGRGDAMTPVTRLVARTHSWRLIPPSKAKPFPEYIPQQIRDDYEEACMTLDLSPKASATLARRCLQGMIRDFWGVTVDSLKKEIDALQDKVDPLTWKAIDAVRSIGNIGAHMEKDVNLIIDVEPDEAGQLIGLIELLFQDWYITRHERQARLKAIADVAVAKAEAKADGLIPTQETGQSEGSEGAQT